MISQCLLWTIQILSYYFFSLEIIDNYKYKSIMKWLCIFRMLIIIYLIHLLGENYCANFSCHFCNSVKTTATTDLYTLIYLINLYTSTKRSQIKRLHVKHRMVGSEWFNWTPPPLPPRFVKSTSINKMSYKAHFCALIGIKISI